MAQSSAPPAGIPARAFTPVQNPVYVYNDDASWKPPPMPHNVLEEPPREPKDVDPRLTSQGTRPPVAGLPQFVPAAYQTPHNVWEYPA
jgi:hypothetical protein